MREVQQPSKGYKITITLNIVEVNKFRDEMGGDISYTGICQAKNLGEIGQLLSRFDEVIQGRDERHYTVLQNANIDQKKLIENLEHVNDQLKAKLEEYGRNDNLESPIIEYSTPDF